MDAAWHQCATLVAANEPLAHDYLAVNRRNWDDRAPLHAASPGYEVTRLVGDPTALSGGPRSWPHCCDPVGGSSCVTGTR